MIAHLWLRFLPALLLSFCASAFADKAFEVASGTYKDALRKAGEAGKPLMLFCWSDSYVDCKREWAQMEEIPETMKKIVVYRINGEQNAPLVKQFEIIIFPTLIILKPDGTEVIRQTSIYGEAGYLKVELERILDKCGPIPKSQKTKKIPSAQKTSAEITAINELKSAQSYLDVGRTNDAVRVWKSVVSKYPGTEAAEMAQERLDKLESSTEKR